MDSYGSGTNEPRTRIVEHHTRGVRVSPEDADTCSLQCAEPVLKPGRPFSVIVGGDGVKHRWDLTRARPCVDQFCKNGCGWARSYEYPREFGIGIEWHYRHLDGREVINPRRVGESCPCVPHRAKRRKAASVATR